jgi:hypothetical protein
MDDFLRLLRHCASRVYAERTGLRPSTNWLQTSTYGLRFLANRRTCDIPYSPYADVGNNKSSSAASELRIVPRERSGEGIRITLERNNFEYSEEAGGRVIFLELRPQVSTPAKPPEQEARPEATEEQQK